MYSVWKFSKPHIVHLFLKSFLQYFSHQGASIFCLTYDFFLLGKPKTCGSNHISLLVLVLHGEKYIYYHSYLHKKKKKLRISYVHFQQIKSFSHSYHFFFKDSVRISPNPLYIQCILRIYFLLDHY